MTTVNLRSDLESLPAYKPGRAPVHDGQVLHKLSSNENPFPPLESVQTAIGATIGEVNRYPQMAAHELAAAISAKFDIDPESIALGSGSVEIISQLIRAVAGPGDEVIYAWRSFEAYPLLTVAAGARGVGVDLDSDYRHNLPAMAAAVTDRTRLILVCNPNNPTGTTIARRELEEFLESVPRSVAVVIDEAYVHFDRDPESPDGVDFFRRHPNVIVAHTFSKAYGLAGLRVGYAIAPPKIATALRKVALPFGVTTLAQVAARASLMAEKELQTRVDTLINERLRVASALRSLGIAVPDSQANFFWFPFGKDTNDSVKTFEKHGVLSRAFPEDGFRVSIGDKVANDAIIAAATELSTL